MPALVAQNNLIVYSVQYAKNVLVHSYYHFLAPIIGHLKMVTDLLNEEELIMLSSIVLGISNMY